MPLVKAIENPEDSHESGSANSWAEWHPSGKPKDSILYNSLSESIQKHNLEKFAVDRLLLGFDPKSGEPVFMSMSKPRSLIIHDSHQSGPDMLKTMAIAIKSRTNQMRFPITILTKDEHHWEYFAQANENVMLEPIDSELAGAERIIRELPYNQSKPHILIIDDLHEFYSWGHSDTSIIQFLIGAGARSCGVYVLASYGYTSNIKTDNATDELIHGNILKAETSSENSLIINNQSIWVPNPV